MNVADLIPGFVDELEKLAHAKQAMLGAALGGAAGYMLSGKSLKSKAVNTVLGAGAGALVGGVAGGLKKRVWDEPRARSHRDLYGYTPSTVGQSPEQYYGD